MTPRELADLTVEVWKIRRRLEEASSAEGDPTVAERLFVASDACTAVTRAILAAAIRQRALNAMEDAA